ncbi:MAG: fructose-specific PTS transporter subunit EIIC, partial [Eubacterium sp.]|nr:fructose-specific PTS transporter subunit EIIC [Eubacterium sp.]
MKITDLLEKNSICIAGSAQDKTDVINKMVDLMNAGGKLSDIETYKKGVFAREEEGTTGIGEGIAIPHCKSDAVKSPGLAAMTIPDGVEYEALDGEPVNLIFLIAAPNTEDNVHLDVLSNLSTMLMDEDFTNNLKSATSADEFLKIIDDAENAKEHTEGIVGDESSKLILAVTACPTGIAHTYMAAEALEKKAQELGYAIKVETRGSGGAKNELTADEIKKADGIIVAADTKVPLDRFDGKPIIITKVADGINKADKLIADVLSGNAPIHKAGSGSGEAKAPAKESGGGIGHAAYTHLMSGVSHMLPFVIGGGILVALAFLIDTICGYGTSAGGNFGTMTPVSAFLKNVGGTAMGLMVPVLAGYIAYSIADRPGLVVGFVGGLIAANGNALIEGFIKSDVPWAQSYNNGTLTGFNKFMADFGFQAPDGGNTVSGFLGGILAGFLAGAIVLLLKKMCKNLPKALDGIKTILIYPLLGVLIIGVLMCMVFNPLIGLANTGLSNMLTSLSDSGLTPVLGLLLGAMMAIDMGGPINKAAYVFGTGMLAQAQTLMDGGSAITDPGVQACYIAMAAVMVGGMVPPIGIAIACWVFPKKFTKEERSSAVSNIVMGCSFITEGAIPFAAADP